MDSLPSLLTLGSLTPQPPQAPRFPSFSEQLSNQAPEQPKQPRGLFASLVRDPAILYSEYLEHPDLFEEDTGHLLATLVGRSKKMEDLTPEEAQQLDEAVVSFLQYQPEKQGKQKLLPPEVREHAESDEMNVVWTPGGPRLGDPYLFSEVPDVSHKWWKEV